MPTILVADDNSNIQKMVSLAFQEKGIRVVAVGNGEAACRKVPEVRPDVVLADVFMPVRNGYEVCEFVRQDPEFAQTPVILLVGAFDPLDEKEAARVGASGVLKKPFVPPEPLINLVSSLLDKTDSQQKRSTEPKTETESARKDSKIEYATEVPFVSPARGQSAPSPNEFRFASAETDSGVEIAPAPRPLAKPAPADAPEEDDLGPENAWVQRRTSMDYEIGAADSADLVERLAGARTDSAEPSESEDEILPSDKHVPFGGANIPELPADKPPKKWNDFLSRENSAPANPPETFENDPAASQHDADGHPSHIFEAAPPQREVAEAEPTAKGHPAESVFSHEPLPAEPSLQDSNIVPFVIHEAETESRSADRDDASEPAFYSGAMLDDPGASPSRNASPKSETGNSEDLGSATEEISYAPNSESDVAATHEEGVRETSEPAIELRPETEPESATAHHNSTPEKADDATVDDVVAKVISKLEPQLHEALANGVLRPLVEQLLNEKRTKK